MLGANLEGWEVGKRFRREGTGVPGDRLIHGDLGQKRTQQCKAIILQLKKITCQCRGHEFDPWSTGCGATKPEHLEPVLRSKRSHGNEKHARHCEEQPLLTTTRGNPHAGTKTWLSQRNKQIQKKNFLMLRKQNFLLDLPVSVLHSCYSRARGLVGEDDWLSRPQTHGWPLGRPRNF